MGNPVVAEVVRTAIVHRLVAAVMGDLGAGLVEGVSIMPVSTLHELPVSRA
jgi:hypothetical protein